MKREEMELYINFCMLLKLNWYQFKLNQYKVGMLIVIPKYHITSSSGFLKLLESNNNNNTEKEMSKSK